MKKILAVVVTCLLMTSVFAQDQAAAPAASNDVKADVKTEKVEKKVVKKKHAKKHKKAKKVEATATEEVQPEAK